MAQVCPVRKRVSACCPSAAVTRHWVLIGVSVALDGSLVLPSQRQSHSRREPAETNRQPESHGIATGFPS